MGLYLKKQFCFNYFQTFASDDGKLQFQDLKAAVQGLDVDFTQGDIQSLFDEIDMTINNRIKKNQLKPEEIDLWLYWALCGTTVKSLYEEFMNTIDEIYDLKFE